jgi:uncharacterized protein YecT (DUF1311 family)
MLKGWWLLLLLACGGAHAASFDCAKAKTPIETAICSSPTLSAADDQMAAAYRSLLSAAPPEVKAEIREDQRSWIRGMALRCRANQSETTDPTGAFEQCLRDDEALRTETLQKMFLREGGVTFVWRTVNLTAPDDTENGPVWASFPVATKDTTEWKAWNKAIDEATRNMDNGRDGVVKASIGPVSERMVSANIESTWQGGAHPNSVSIQFHWLLKEQRELVPDDVFKPGAGWEGLLQKRCDESLHRQLDETLDGDYQKYLLPGEMQKKLHEIVTDPERWQLDGKGLTITFQRYTVCSYACVANPVTIPWPELQPFLQPNFVTPK